MKPIPTAILRTATQLPNATVNSPARVGLSTDVQGADPQALEKFNQALPKSRGAANKLAGRKLPWEDEIMAAREEVLADAQEWQMAMTEVTGAGAGGSVGGAAGGAAGAAEAGGAAVAGGAGGTAGAAAAAAGVSPLAFAPALALGGGGGGNFINTPPVLTLPTEVRLATNGTGDVQCAVARATDVDLQQLRYSFLEDGRRVSSVEVYSKVAEGQDPVLLGEFSIDPVSGQISFQYAEGANEALMCDQTTLTVVAFDGIDQSAPRSITIEWAFDVDASGVLNLADAGENFVEVVEPDTPVLSDLLSDLQHEDEDHESDEFDGRCLDYVYARSEEVTVLAPLTGRHSGSQLIYAGLSTDGLFEVNPPPASMLGFEAFRNGAGLTMGWAHLVDWVDDSVPRLNGYLSEVTLTGYPQWTGTDGFVYVHFDQGSTFAGYDLGQSGVADDLYVPPCAGDGAEYPYLEQEHGVYRVSKLAEGTECNDLIAGALGQVETLNGGAGNDLIFANSHEDGVTYRGDVVIGGSGDDLIVLSGEGHTLQFEADQASNGSDVVVGFDEYSTLELQAGELVSVLCGNDVVAEGFDGYVFSQSGEDVVLTRWNDGVAEIRWNDGVAEIAKMATFIDTHIEVFKSYAVLPG